MKIVIEVIPHSEQKLITTGEPYDTAGNWWWEDEDGKPNVQGTVLQMRISDMGDYRKEACVAYHELFEALACRANGITQDVVDAFDKGWQEHNGIEEAGDDPEAPYHLEHVQAGIPERLLALALGLEWDEYNESVMSL